MMREKCKYSYGTYLIRKCFQLMNVQLKPVLGPPLYDHFKSIGVIYISTFQLFLFAHYCIFTLWVVIGNCHQLFTWETCLDHGIF